MNKKIIYVIIILALVIGLIIFLNPVIYTNNLKKVDIEKTNKIYNRTDVKSLDTIYKKGFEILGIENKTFIIVEIDKNQLSVFGDDLDLKGTVIDKGNYYLIKTKLGNNKEMIDIASHELIHIKQMVNGYFSYSEYGVYYKGEYYEFPLKGSYRNVPWEVEAYDEAPELLIKMKDSLLQKNN